MNHLKSWKGGSMSFPPAAMKRRLRQAYPKTATPSHRLYSWPGVPGFLGFAGSSVSVFPGHVSLIPQFWALCATDRWKYPVYPEGIKCWVNPWSWAVFHFMCICQRSLYQPFILTAACKVEDTPTCNLLCGPQKGLTVQWAHEACAVGGWFAGLGCECTERVCDGLTNNARWVVRTGEPTRATGVPQREAIRGASGQRRLEGRTRLCPEGWVESQWNREYSSA